MTRPAKPRKSPVQLRSRQTFEAIVEAGTRILTNDGYDAMTTNEVADLAGVSIGSLYQYFSGKDAILGAVFERHQSRIRDAIGGHFDTATDLSDFAATRRLIEAVVQSHATEGKLHARLEVLRQDGALPNDVGEDQLSYLSEKLSLILQRDFSEPAEQANRSARLLVCAVHALIQAHDSGDIQCSREILIEDVSRLVFRFINGQ